MNSNSLLLPHLPSLHLSLRSLPLSLHTNWITAPMTNAADILAWGHYCYWLLRISWLGSYQVKGPKPLRPRCIRLFAYIYFIVVFLCLPNSFIIWSLPSVEVDLIFMAVPTFLTILATLFCLNIFLPSVLHYLLFSSITINITFWLHTPPLLPLYFPSFCCFDLVNNIYFLIVRVPGKPFF